MMLSPSGGAPKAPSGGVFHVVKDLLVQDFYNGRLVNRTYVNPASLLLIQSHIHAPCIYCYSQHKLFLRPCLQRDE